MKPPIEYRPRFNALKGSDPITAADVLHPEHLALLKVIADKRALKAAQMRRYRAKRKTK